MSPHDKDTEEIRPGDVVIPARIREEHHAEIFGDGLLVEGLVQLVEQSDGTYGLKVTT